MLHRTASSLKFIYMMSVLQNLSNVAHLAAVMTKFHCIKRKYSYYTSQMLLYLSHFHPSSSFSVFFLLFSYSPFLPEVENIIEFEEK